jgi:hypothetical protein
MELSKPGPFALYVGIGVVLSERHLANDQLQQRMGYADLLVV